MKKLNDRMTPLPFSALMDRTLNGDSFGIRKFYTAQAEPIPLFHEKLETPIGPAAGPHTQLAQNIISAYLAGARFFELKTVQTLDGEDLPVSKPCILAEDECYNVEWSTELTVGQAFDEYVKAWWALKLISQIKKLGDPEGFMFNMSVGYDLEGIKSKKIDTFIEGLKDASRTPIWNECKLWAEKNADALGLDGSFISSVSPNICSSITLSTLHGCPAEQIELIAEYLMKEKNLNTFVKCNPTMLGYDTARAILDKMGYSYVSFGDLHFKEDLQFSDAIPMLRRLTSCAEQRGLQFGVKLTNTCPVDITRGELPGEEMYMSGKALYPLSITLAEKLSAEFDGKLRISYSGGADAFNAAKLFSAGIYPITMATTLLKPGGYQRLTQIAENVRKLTAMPPKHVNSDALKQIIDTLPQDGHIKKPIKPLPKRKGSAKVPMFDCFAAPCSTFGCPIGQDIPEYLALTEQGRYDEAIEVITRVNPLPTVTGIICTQKCAEKCRRSFYDEPLRIRQAKLKAAEEALGRYSASLSKPEQNGKRAAIVGGGAAGISAAYFLARSGFGVTIFEKEKKLGGVVRNIIPEFRIPDDAIEKDIELIKALGVEIKTEVEITPESFESNEYDYVILAVGAPVPSHSGIQDCKSIDALSFLRDYKTRSLSSIGKNTAVIGGGNTAMDAARAAKRSGAENVNIIYRRDAKNMPADEEELLLARQDGIVCRELLEPIRMENGNLICRVMKLGEPDETGRAKPEATGALATITADTVITAIGDRPDAAFIQAFGAVNPDAETCRAGEKLYVIGDGRRGPASVVLAISDAKNAAHDIMLREGIRPVEFTKHSDLNKNAADKKGILIPSCSGTEDCSRCLACDSICECCVDVCPNRANAAINVHGAVQILHIDKLCNFCGNCAAFCPYDSAPYLDKLTLYHTAEEFYNGSNNGFMLLDTESLKIRLRLGGEIKECFVKELDKKLFDIIETLVEKYSYLLV